MELRRDINSLIELNDVTHIRTKRVVSGFVIGTIASITLLLTVTPSIPLVIAVSCLVPLVGGIGYYSVKQQFPEEQLDETLRRVDHYEEYIKLLMRLLQVNNGDEVLSDRIASFCDKIAELPPLRFKLKK